MKYEEFIEQEGVEPECTDCVHNNCNGICELREAGIECSDMSEFESNL